MNSSDSPGCEEPAGAREGASYTIVGLAQSLSTPRVVALAATAAIALACMHWCLQFGRRGQEALALTACIALMLLVSPLVWLTYLALFLVLLRDLRPRRVLELGTPPADVDLPTPAAGESHRPFLVFALAGLTVASLCEAPFVARMRVQLPWRGVQFSRRGGP